MLDRAGLGFRANIVEKCVVLGAVLHVAVPHKSIVLITDQQGFSRLALHLLVFLVIHAERNLHVSLGPLEFQRLRTLFRPSVLDGTGLGLRANTAEYVLLAFSCCT